MTEPETPVIIDEGDFFWQKKVLSDVCTFCVHSHDDINHTCDSFPDRIPEEIWLGFEYHVSPYPGDHGIQFERDADPITRMIRNGHLPDETNRV